MSKNVCDFIINFQLRLVLQRPGGQIGDKCGPCSDRTKNFYCGNCDNSKGLECLTPQQPSAGSTPKCQLPLSPPRSTSIDYLSNAFLK